MGCAKFCSRLETTLSFGAMNRPVSDPSRGFDYIFSFSEVAEMQKASFLPVVAIRAILEFYTVCGSIPGLVRMVHRSA